MRTSQTIAFLVVAGLAAGCGSEAPTEASAVHEAASQAEDVRPAVALPRTSAPDGARVWFVEPADGATVTSPVRLVFGASGVDIVPAGNRAENSGHHHLIINADLPSPDQPIPADEQHRHFGTGATDAELALAPGEYRLVLLLGDHLHIPHDPPIYSAPITITVTE